MHHSGRLHGKAETGRGHGQVDERMEGKEPREANVGNNEKKSSHHTRNHQHHQLQPQQRQQHGEKIESKPQTRRDDRRRRSGLPGVNAAELFNMHRENSTPKPVAAALGISPEALELFQASDAAFWGKTVEMFTSIASKSSPISQSIQALTDLIEIATACPPLLPPFGLVAERAIKELCDKSSDLEGYSIGIFHAINFTKASLLPFAASLIDSDSAAASASTFALLPAYLICWGQTLRSSFGKMLTRMESLTSAKSGKTMQRTFSSSSGPVDSAPLLAPPVSVISTRDLLAAVDSHLRDTADKDNDAASMASRDESVELIRSVLQKDIANQFAGKEVNVRVFGSTLTGLTQPRSDIDMTVIPLSAKDSLKDLRNSIITDLKATELELKSLSELERAAFVVNGCINEFENVQCSEGSITSRAVGCSSEYNILALREAKRAFRDLAKMYKSLEVTAEALVMARESQRERLLSVDRDLLKEKKKLLYRLSDTLRRLGYWEVEPVLHARIGVIHFLASTKQNPTVPWQCDLVVNQRLGIENSRLIHAYLEFDRSGTVRRFLRLVKSFAKSHKLNAAPSGMLSSYAWIIIGLHFLLKIGAIPNFQSDKNPTISSSRTMCDGIDVSFSVPAIDIDAANKLGSFSLSDLLLRFFSYLTEEVDLSMYTLTMRGAGEVVPKSVWGRCPSWRISIEDPFERSDSSFPHDLGSTLSTTGQEKILRDLDSVLSGLRAAYATGDSNEITLAWDATFQGLPMKKSSKQVKVKEDGTVSKKRRERKTRQAKVDPASLPDSSAKGSYKADYKADLPLATAIEAMSLNEEEDILN